MPASFRKIDYSLRPAKHAERRMLLEVFGRAAAFAPLGEYAYTGMGSVWFYDFVLVHRYLGIHDMTSIEYPHGYDDRFNSNLPLASIKMVYNTTTLALPELDWAKRQIVWLDYDKQISPGILTDVSAVISRAASGTLLTISIQCNSAKEVEQEDAGGLDAFRDVFGRERIGEIEELDLYGWRFGELSRRLIVQEVESALALRNVEQKGHDKLNYTTICEFEYADDAKMTTICLLLYAEIEAATLAACDFNRLDFVKSCGTVVRIEIPYLTNREMLDLRRQLPTADLDSIEVKYIPPAEARKFGRLYRYLPNFAVLEV